MSETTLRPATLADLALLQSWDEKPHVIESDPNDDWHWEQELERPVPWTRNWTAWRIEGWSAVPQEGGWS